MRIANLFDINKSLFGYKKKSFKKMICLFQIYFFFSKHNCEIYFTQIKFSISNKFFSQYTKEISSATARVLNK